MIGLAAGTRIWIVAGVTDMRRGFDTLAAQVRALARQRHAPVTIADLWALAGEST